LLQSFALPWKCALPGAALPLCPGGAHPCPLPIPRLPQLQNPSGEPPWPPEKR
jgi:hypothetical protein